MEIKKYDSCSIGDFVLSMSPDLLKLSLAKTLLIQALYVIFSSKIIFLSSVSTVPQAVF